MDVSEKQQDIKEASEDARPVDNDANALNQDSKRPEAVTVVANGCDSGTPSSEEEAPASLDDDLVETYPEGGLRAWLVVFGSWMALFSSFGFMNTLATFHAYVSSNQLRGYGTGAIGWIFSVYTFVCFLCGVFVGPIFDKHGPRWLILAGSLCNIAAVLLLSICTAYWHFLLVFSFLLGLGSALIFTPSIAAVGHWFSRRRGLATGIASTGGSMGGIVFPLMLRRLFDTVGWATALRVLAAVCAVACLLACLLVRSRLPPASGASAWPDLRILIPWRGRRKRPRTDAGAGDGVVGGAAAGAGGRDGQDGENDDNDDDDDDDDDGKYSTNLAFSFTTLATFLLEIAMFIPLTYLTSYALAAGFDEGFAFRVLSVVNAASVFGRALPGYFADYFGPFNTNALFIALSAVVCFAVWWPAGSTTAGLVCFAALFGFASGSNISLTPVCVGRLCRTQNYGSYYATCYTVVSVGCLIGIPIAGSLIEACGGEYWGLILLTALSYCGAAAALVAAKISRVGWSPWVIF